MSGGNCEPRERGRTLERVLRLIALLSVWRTYQELAGELGVCQRTIRRDLEVLDRAGFAVTQDRDSREVYVRILSPVPYTREAR